LPSCFPGGLPPPDFWAEISRRKRPLEPVTLYRALVRSPDAGVMRFVAFSTAAELSEPEHGGVRIRADTVKRSYILDVCVADWDEERFRQFFLDFARFPSVREPFRMERVRGHPGVPVSLPGGVVTIDKPLARAIAELNARGTITAGCCQGGGWARNTSAYIILAPGSRFPDELVAAWRGAGYVVTDDGVFTHPLFGLADAASERFVRSLEDWLDGRLDVSGKSYRVPGPRPFSWPGLKPAVSRAGPRL
jgi:hypothetical protein